MKGCPGGHRFQADVFVKDVQELLRRSTFDLIEEQAACKRIFQKHRVLLHATLQQGRAASTNLSLRDQGCHAYVPVQVLAAVAVRAVADSHTSDRAGLLCLRCASCCGCMTCNAACAVSGCDGCYQEGQRLKQRQPRQCGAAAVNLFARHGRWRYCEERSRVAR